MRPHPWLMLAVFILLAVAAGAIGRAVNPPTLTTWYAALHRPSWTPSPAEFRIVWTSIFVLMGIAAWMVWKTAGFYEAEMPLLLFFIQLALNAAWSWIFFGLHNMAAAYAENIAVWALTIATAVLFWRIRRVAGVLMLPGIAWLCFSLVLNAAIWRMNWR